MKKEISSLKNELKSVEEFLSKQKEEIRLKVK